MSKLLVLLVRIILPLATEELRTKVSKRDRTHFLRLCHSVEQYAVRWGTFSMLPTLKRPGNVRFSTPCHIVQSLPDIVNAYNMQLVKKFCTHEHFLVIILVAPKAPPARRYLCTFYCIPLAQTFYPSQHSSKFMTLI